MGALKRIWPLVAALGSGGMLALAYAPWDYSVMVGLGLLPLLAAVWLGGGERRRGWYGFGIGYLAGASFWLINLKWIAEVGVIGLIAVALYLALYFGLWGALAAGVGNPWRRPEGRRAESGVGGGIEEKVRLRRERSERARGRSWRESKRVVGYAALVAFWWCGLEWVRGWFLTGFGWNGLGVAFHDLPVVAQSADLVGVTGLAFLPLFIMAVVVQVGRGLHQEVASGSLRAHWDFGGAMVLASLVFVYGIWKLQTARQGETVPVHVLLVQLNIPQEASRRTWEPHEIHAGFEDETLGALDVLEERNAERVATAAGEAVTLDWPDWVVWPESALTDFLPFDGEGAQRTLLPTQSTMDAIRPRGAFSILFGLNEVECVFEDGRAIPVEGGRSYNSLLALAPGEDSFRTYRKQHLVLFGETIPYREQLKFLQKLWEWSAGTSYVGSFSAGEGGDPLRLPLSRAKDGEVALIPTICFEDTVPRKMRKFVRNGGEVIVNVTNDGWFKESEAAAQHFANAKFRSIEFRRPTVRCANTGVSAVIGVDGRVSDPETGKARMLVDESGSHLTRGWLYATAHVPEAGPLTVYARFGDWFPALGFVLGLGWWVMRGRRRGGAAS